MDNHGSSAGKKLTEEQKRVVLMAAATMTAGLLSTFTANDVKAQVRDRFGEIFDIVKERLLSE